MEARDKCFEEESRGFWGRGVGAKCFWVKQVVWKGCTKKGSRTLGEMSREHGSIMGEKCKGPEVGP